MSAAAVIEEPPSGSGSVDSTNPWPGIASFTENDAPFFRGRDAEVEELFRIVNRVRLTVLFGRTGLGKTSLLHAGLAPRLRPAMLPVIIRLDFDAPGPLDLAAQVLQKVVAAADESGIECPPPEPGLTLWEYFHRRESDFWSEDNEMIAPVIIFDQFEEVFTHGTRDAARLDATQEFLKQLADLVEGRAPEQLKTKLDRDPKLASGYLFTRHMYKVVLALREDYLAHLEASRQHMPSVMSNRLRVVEMNGESALSVVRPSNAETELVTGQAALKIVRLAAGERRTLVWRGDQPATDADLQAMEVNPTLLSVLCRELNEKRIRREQAQIDETLLNTGSAEILQTFYDRSMVGISPAVRQFIERTLVLESGQRDSVPRNRLIEAVGPVLATELDRLIKRRLVTVERRNDVDRIELAHDVLASIIHARRIEGPNVDLSPLIHSASARWLRRAKMLAAIVLIGALAIGLAIQTWRIQENQREMALLRAMRQRLLEQNKQISKERTEALNKYRELDALINPHKGEGI